MIRSRLQQESEFETLHGGYGRIDCRSVFRGFAARRYTGADAALLLATSAAEEATAEPTGTGAWCVTLDVRARKVAVDSVGVVTEIPMDDLVEVGVFAAAEGEEPMYLQQHRVRSGEQTIIVTVPGKPARRHRPVPPADRSGDG